MIGGESAHDAVAMEAPGTGVVVRLGGGQLLNESGQGLVHGAVKPVPVCIRDTDEGPDGVQRGLVWRQQGLSRGDREPPVRRVCLDRGAAATEQAA